MPDFFISYHGADEDWTEWIAWTLLEASYLASKFTPASRCWRASM